jgi:hypothetical protein
MGEAHICELCKTPMILGDCFRCKGFGKVGLIFGWFPRTCPRCSGTKQRYRCTNYRAHKR